MKRLILLLLLALSAPAYAVPTPVPAQSHVLAQHRWWEELQAADLLAQQGDWPEAITKLKELTERVPPQIRAMIYLRLASIHANQAQFNQAIADGHRAIASFPDNGWVYLPVAKIMLAAGKNDEALQICQDAIKQDPAVKSAADDLMDEIRANMPNRWIPWALGGAGGLGGLLILGFWTLKRRQKTLPPPVLQTEHSLPSYYPITDQSYHTGDTIAHYKIISVIGSTLHSILYCAQDTRLDRLVALKQVNPGVGPHGETALVRFQKEVKSLISLSSYHAGIIKVYDFIEPGLLVMEWIEGDTLEDAELEADRLIEIGVELCDILEFSHSKGIIHRDIKPSNIMLTSQTHQIKLLDFGIAKNAALATSHTIDAQVPIGTFTYMAPEQFAAPNQAQSGSDVYSLGLTLYRCLTGRLPTDPWFGPRTFGLASEQDFAPITAGSKAIATYLRHRSLEDTDWIQDLDAAVRRAFSEDPQKRPTTQEFGAQLRKIWHRIEGR